jgi:hypothetical protein
MKALDIVSGTLPLTLLGLPAIAIQLIVQHSNVDYTLGPLQKILAIGPVHRLHHVNWAGEGDVNFGLLFTAWDRLLGTFKLPHGRKPTIGDIGIQDCPHAPQDAARGAVRPGRVLPEGLSPGRGSSREPADELISEARALSHRHDAAVLGHLADDRRLVLMMVGQAHR